MIRFWRWLTDRGVDLTKVSWPTRERRPALYHDGASVAELLRRLK